MAAECYASVCLVIHPSTSVVCWLPWCLQLLCAGLDCLIGLSDHSDLCVLLLRVNRAVGEGEGLA